MKRFRGRFRDESVASAPAFFFAAIVFACLPPALFADDLPGSRQTVVSGDASHGDNNSSVRWGNTEIADSPAQTSQVRRDPSQSSATSATPVAAKAAPTHPFAHTKWEVSEAVAPCTPDLRWKGLFQTGQKSVIMADPDVLRTSGETPMETGRPTLLPDSVPREFTNRPDAREIVQRAVVPPPPVRIASAAEPSAAPLPTLEQQLLGHPNLPEKCTSPASLKSITKITADIGVKPDDVAGNKPLPPECSLDDARSRPRHWRPVTFAWTATGTCHYPLYFEDEQLERYGHSWGNVRQTAVSAVKFFATVPLVPYYMGVYPPNESIYDLGQYRPGSCAPYYLDPLPLSVRGALYEGAFLGLLPTL